MLKNNIFTCQILRNMDIFSFDDKQHASKAHTSNLRSSMTINTWSSFEMHYANNFLLKLFYHLYSKQYLFWKLIYQSNLHTYALNIWIINYVLYALNVFSSSIIMINISIPSNWHCADLITIIPTSLKLWG